MNRIYLQTVYLLFYNFTDTVIKVLRSRGLGELSQSQTEQIHSWLLRIALFQTWFAAIIFLVS